MNSFATEYPNNNGVYNQNGGMPGYDPSMFNANGQNLDVNRPPMQNGSISQAYPNQQFQVNQVVPSKRPRPSEDSTGASPRPGSRSQTPQMPYPGYQGNPMQAPTPFPQHLQQGGSQNATPSPTMQPQQFRPPGAPGAPPQRVNTNSPNPGPFQQQQGMGMSPPPNGPQGRVNPAQNPGMAQMRQQMGFMPPGAQMQPGFPPQYGGQPGMPPGMQGNMPVLPPHLQNKTEDVQRMYQMRVQQQQMAAAGQQQRPPGMNAMYNAQGQPQNMPPGMQAMAPGGMPGGMPAPGNPQQDPQQFLRKLAQLHAQYGKPFNPQPAISGMPLSLPKLWSAMQKLGGNSMMVTQRQMWPQVAHMMGFSPQQFPSAPQEVKIHYEHNLLLWEQWQREQQKRPQPQPGQIVGTPGGPPQMSPTRAMPPGQMTPQQQQQYMQHMQMQQMQRQHQPQHPEQMTPARQMSMQSANGWSTPQPTATPTRPEHAAQQRKSLSRPGEGAPPYEPGQLTTPSPGGDVKGFGRPPTSKPAATNGQVETHREPKSEHGSEYMPAMRNLANEKLEPTWGGLPIEQLAVLGEDILRLKPAMPELEEMGLIDVRAVKLSIESGIHSEVRNALDCLAKVTNHPQWSLELERSEDLLDVLIDCGQDQVDQLEDGSSEISDVVELIPYEDLLRLCKEEHLGLQNIPEFGTEEYDLESAANRLISITVILRNISFGEMNQHILNSPTVTKFISNVIRLLGTRSQFLRTHINTVDFMKDIIIYLSNTTQHMTLPSRDDALNILQFLLAFAPSPPPGNPVRFSPYDPKTQKYLPAAVDCLAKLLARDDPNRAFYRTIFNNDAGSSPPYDLLTRSFGLAISVLPDRVSRHLTPKLEFHISATRKAHFTQGMLAADILASLAPGPEAGVARSWLEAEDGWAASLIRNSFLLLADPAPPRPPPGHRGPPPPHRDIEEEGFHLITHRALSMIRRLAEKSGKEQAPISAAPSPDVDDDDDRMESINGDSSSHKQLRTDFRGASSLILQIETLMGALVMAAVDAKGLNKLVKFGDMLD